MRNRFAVVLACCCLALSACSGTSFLSDGQACSRLKPAIRSSFDLELGVFQTNYDTLDKILPPTSETVAQFHELESRVNELAVKIGTGDKADLARQLSVDLETMLQDAQGQMNAKTGALLMSKSHHALLNDYWKRVELCGL